MTGYGSLAAIVATALTMALSGQALSSPFAGTAQFQVQDGKSRSDAIPVQSSDQQSERVQLIGIVQSGKLEVLFPRDQFPPLMDLTTIARQEARSPESGALDLHQYSGSVIMVEGIADSGWLYEAHVIDAGGPLITTLSRILLDNPGK